MGLALAKINKKEDLEQFTKEDLIDICWDNMQQLEKIKNEVLDLDKEKLIEYLDDIKFISFFGKLINGTLGE